MQKLKRHASAMALFAISMLVLIPVQAQAQLGSLIVTMSSPASGATVSGTVPVSATVSVVGLLTVSSVQFQLDGANLGGADTSAPYSVSWSTTTASNGPHTLTAVARTLIGGLQFTSNPVTVTVANDTTPPPPPPPSARFEETDPSISYTSGWNQGDTSETWSGGTAAISTAPGAQATFTFTGPSVTWIGGRAPSTGIASVSVDGVFQRNVDTYSKTDEIRVPMFEATDLSNTTHTLTIVVTGQQNAAATGNAIVIDAFDVPAVTISRLQETDPSVSFSTANWVQGDTSRAWSAGIAALANQANAQVTFTFTGTAVTWIGANGPQTGMANVFIDGAQVASNLDTYAPAEHIQAPIFTANGLSNSSHTISIQVTGQHNPAASDAIVVVDAFEVITPGVRHQETDPAVSYGGGWIQDNRDKAYSEGATAESETTGAQATITFTGTGISWIGARGPQTGIARISLDGVFVEEFDTYAPTEGPQHTDYSTSGLARGTHTLTIEVAGKNAISTNAWILIDAFDVIP
ncbi:MAG TPA: Ig-like domain-containing protein [Burkholderiales bacterium]|nr:Ig-like domain-containing protein [Burkholderiales bacterium]